MERVLQGRSATISMTFTVDGVPTNPSPDSATVEILRADGTVLVAPTAATESGVGKFDFQLTPTHTAQLDTLTVRWRATFSGQQQTIEDLVEVAGGFLFSIAAARRKKPLDNAAKYTDALLAWARTVAEQAIEDECGVAFVPRYARERVHGRGRDTILLKPRLRAVRSVSIDGSPVIGNPLAELVPDPVGELYRPAGWPRGRGNVIVGYEHGYDQAPGRISNAAILLAKQFLIDSQIDDRALRVTDPDGRETVYSAPGVRNIIFSIPEVEGAVKQYGVDVGLGLG